MFWSITIPFIIMDLILQVLPSFYNYRNIITKTTTGCCISGRNGKKGRHVDRNHVWWHGSPHKNKKSHTQNVKNDMFQRNRIDLLQCFDPLTIPSSIIISDDDAFYDPNNIDHYHTPPTWIPPDSLPKLAITKEAITLFIDAFNVLSHYQIIKSLDVPEDLYFYNSRYHSLHSSSPRYKRITIQARHLKSQVFHYHTTFNNCTDSTPVIYVPCCVNEPPVVIDTDASGSITPLGSAFIDGVIYKADLQELKQINGSTDRFHTLSVILSTLLPVLDQSKRRG
jgi:hypothetical protein